MLDETQDKEFELPDKFYSLSDIQNYFEYIIKKHEKLNDKPPVEIHFKRIQNSVTFRITSAIYLELLNPESQKLQGSAEE